MMNLSQVFLVVPYIRTKLIYPLPIIGVSYKRLILTVIDLKTIINYIDANR